MRKYGFNGGMSSRAVMLSMLMAVSPVWAADMPWHPVDFEYRATGKSVARVIEDIFATQQRPVEISDAARNLPALNGTFNIPPAELFSNLKKSYGLVSYFDGSTVYVTTLAENREAVHALTRTSPATVERTAREMGYLDSAFRFRILPGASVVQVNGPPAYLQRIADAVSIAERGALRNDDDTRLGFRVVRLKHAWAEDVRYTIGGKETVIRGVANSLRDLVSNVSGADPRRKPAPLPAQVERPSGMLAELMGASRESTAGFPLASMSPLSPFGAGEGLVAGPEGAANAQIKIVGDSRMNAVVLMAPRDMLGPLEEIVTELDVEPELIQIEASIMDVRDGVLKELGFDWALQGRSVRIGSTSTGAGIGEDLKGDAARGGGANISIFGGSAALKFLSSITALQSEGKAQIQSRPRLATLNGIEAVLSDQSAFYPRVSNERVAQLFQVDVGLLMRVLPIVIRRNDGSVDIRLQIFIEDGNLGRGSVGDLPVTSKSTISTQAIVKEGESLLIGGYVRDVNEASESKVPLLGDIPVMGALFRFRNGNVERKERLIMITPRLINAGAEHADQRGAFDSELNPRDSWVARTLNQQSNAWRANAASQGGAPDVPAVPATPTVPAAPAPSVSDGALFRPSTVRAQSGRAPTQVAPDIVQPMPTPRGAEDVLRGTAPADSQTGRADIRETTLVPEPVPALIPAPESVPMPGVTEGTLFRPSKSTARTDRAVPVNAAPARALEVERS
ncbi:type III secretion system outer membrane ring subunit SctC [Pandoraea sp. NPDC087047]|uniref:type III secretion system outer membrane ring subunit SctC n=1 Tax=Pandoraea sp. NPDC087047 TaxID=3364390 RepID=UPI0038265950